ncbi:hypothetical protein Sp14A_19140 [Streptococcus pluranimalium]|uniref:Uncharacterized protein n=1 Tax=Streptococcus pluranimalium TaxID=82348 RepID=A0A345VM50_9STRE|nr:hypothetical protein Sp14A_19140 [Streptococcus pluranimalium]
MKEERDLVFAAKSLEISLNYLKEEIIWTYAFYEGGLAIDVLCKLNNPKKRAVGLKRSDGMVIPTDLVEFKFACQKFKLIGTIRSS